MASTTKTPRVRWECPTGEHPAVLGPTRPRLKSLVRYCVPCSVREGVLIERVAPAVERARDRAAARTAAKRAAKRRRELTAREKARQRENERFQVEGVDLRTDMARFARLPVFGGARGKLAKRPPEFDVTHRSYSGNRLGFASPWEWRIHLTLYPGIPLAQARRTIVHELCHLHVGQGAGREWHGAKFRATLAQALREAGLRPEDERRDVVLTVDN